MLQSPGCPDSILIDRLRAGDPAAFATVYDRYHRLALSVALSVCRHHETAEDVVQHAFFEIWRTAGRFDPAISSLKTWILTVVRYRAIDARRRLAVLERRLDGGRYTSERTAPDDTSEIVAGRADAALVREALRRLPAPQRAALALAYDRQLSQSEIAAVLRIPVGTVKSRTRLGLAALRLTPEMTAITA